MLDWFWLVELAFALAAYIVLDGFDLGVGILSGFAPGASRRDEMAAAITPVWDGNGTWLVIAGTILFGAFPAVYSIAIPALYAPLSAMLAGLIMRGVALEFRHKAHSSRWVWNLLLFAGSLLAAFAQGVAVGTYAKGLPVVQMHYAGNGFEWATAFPLWCGLGAVLCYALLGAGWLVLKGETELRKFGCAALSRLTPITVVVVAAMFAATLVSHRVIAARWAVHPALFVLPALCVVTLVGAPLSARRGEGRTPFILVAASCALLLLMLVTSYLPYVVPFDLTLTQAAAPASSQTFMFWGGGLFVLPLIVAYTYVAYTVFRGRVSSDHAYH